MSARNNIDNYASFNIRDLMPTTRNFIKAQIVEAQSVIKKATPMYNSQFHQKPLSKSILGKRSQSVHRLATISTRNEPSQDVIYVNSRKLDTMMPLGNETVETGGDDNKDMNLKYKNLNRLMKSEKEIKVVPKERLIGPFAQAKKVQGENRDWQTLPEEFKKIPLFQAIYLKKKESLIDYRLLAGDDVPAYMKSNYKVPENLRFWKPSSEHKEPEEIKSQSKVDSNNKFEYDSKYYGVDTIRYQNYKYHKVLSNVKERRYSPNKMFEQKISVEFLAHDIHTQRRSIKELENQRIEIMQKREQMKNDKRLSQPRTSKQQQNVSLDHINEEDKESQKTIENNNLNKVYELNMCADMDLISRSKESSLNFIQSERELRSKKGESPKVSPRFNKGSLTERNRGGGSPEKRKGNSPSKKIATVIGSPWGIEKMYYSKECKQEFEELCQISQDWLDEMKNGGIDNERDEKALQTHMKLHSPKIDAGIYLPVFLETQGMYIRQKKFITDRILLALGLNPLNKFSMINMENFSKFQRIFVAKDASDTELVDFMIQFFKIDDNEEVLQDSFILVLKSMTDRNENYNRFAEVLNSSYDVLLENYRIFGVMRENSGFVDFDNFREVYLSNKMNISDLADLITNLN